ERVVVPERERDRLGELSLVVRLRDPHGRTEAGRLHEAREAEWILRRITVTQGDVAGNGNTTVAQNLLEEVLVHAERRRRDASADVGNPCELQEPLHGAVLAERAVQDRQDDVDGAERRGRVRGRNGQGLRDGTVPRAELPAALSSDRDGHDLVALGVERLEHGTG